MAAGGAVQNAALFGIRRPLNHVPQHVIPHVVRRCALRFGTFYEVFSRRVGLTGKAEEHQSHERQQPQQGHHDDQRRSVPPLFGFRSARYACPASGSGSARNHSASCHETSPIQELSGGCVSHRRSVSSGDHSIRWSCGSPNTAARRVHMAVNSGQHAGCLAVQGHSFSMGRGVKKCANDETSGPFSPSGTVRASVAASDRTADFRTGT